MFTDIDLKYPTDNSSTIVEVTHQNDTTGNHSWQQIANELFKRIWIRDEKFKSQLTLVSKLINYNDIVFLFLGETGVGKSYLAEQIHKISNRRRGAFIDYNCARSNSTKGNNEIFGWKKGSFTGATSDYPGLVGLANGGTLFLDETHSLDIDFVHLLKTFIETKKYRPLGSKEEYLADESIILGTNCNPQDLVREKKWPLDFYYRINNVVVTIPPLRNIKESIPELVRQLMNKFNDKYAGELQIDSSAINYLCGFEWPGNIRQLENYLRVKYLDCKEENYNIIEEDLLISDPPIQNVIKKGTKYNDFERTVLELIQNWEQNDKNILDKQILPIIAKVYRESSRSKLWRMHKEYYNI
jgi:transcriptional regulator with PAS, ATPase and Fis domain